MSKSLNHLKIVNLQKTIFLMLKQTIESTFKIKNFEPEVKWSTVGNSDLSSASAVKLFNSKMTKCKSIQELANEIANNFPKNDFIKDIKISKLISEKKCNHKDQSKESNLPKELSNEQSKDLKKDDQYFIDFFVCDQYLQSSAQNILKENKLNIDFEQYKEKKVLVDFSSPNIAKEMHVGHLRSTIIGDSISRILEYIGCDVMRINHVGDWGTQFGMLITKLKDDYPNYINEKPNLSDLENFYVDAKIKFSDANNTTFRKKSHENTVLLQSGDENTVKAWKLICEASRLEFNEIYRKLNIKITEQGESFYNDIIRKLIPELEKKGFIEISEGAKVIKLPEVKNPVIIVKSDNGFNYSTTDLAALYYRLNDLQRNWVIYVVGNEQKNHLKSIFYASKKIGILNCNETKLSHVSFGHVLNKKGIKFSTSEGNVIKLKELLNESVKRAKNETLKRSLESKVLLSEKEILENAEKIGYSSIKYYDLKQPRESNYKFDFDLILDPKGNTAIYQFYNYVRINSIKRRANVTSKDIISLTKNNSIKISHEKERDLLLTIIKFQETMENTILKLRPNILAEFMYEVSIKFSNFFAECQILESDEKINRLMIVELTAIVMRQGFDLLGMTPIDRL